MPDEIKFTSDYLERLKAVEKESERLDREGNLRFDNLNCAIELARQIAEKAENKALTTVDIRLDKLNDTYRRIERMENLFATKTEMAALYRLVYLATGGLLVLEFAFRFLIKQ